MCSIIKPQSGSHNIHNAVSTVCNSIMWTKLSLELMHPRAQWARGPVVGSQAGREGLENPANGKYVLCNKERECGVALVASV